MNRNSTRARDRRRFVATTAALLFGGAALAQDRVAVRSRRSGDRIRVLGGVMEWRLTPAETGETYFLMESLVGPGAGVPPHRHPEQEGFYVLEGAVEYARASGADAMEWLPAGTGDCVHIPGNAWHGWRNRGTRPARILVTGPARLGHFFAEAGVPFAGEGYPGPPTPEDIRRVSAVMARYGHEFLR